MSDGKVKVRDFTSGSIFPQLISLAWPMMVTMALQLVYNIVDMAVVGHAMGKTGLSAISVGGELTQFFIVFSAGMAMAGQVIIATFIGKGERHRISDAVGTLMTTVIAMGLIVDLLLAFCGPVFLKWMNCPDDAYGQAVTYVFTCSFGYIFIYGYDALAAIFRATGNSRSTLIFIALSSVLNLILDIVFVNVLHMQAFGAALATVIGQICAFAASSYYLYIKRKDLELTLGRRSFIPQKDLLGSMLKIGIPTGMQFCAVAFSMLMTSSWINAYGTAVSAVNGAGGKLRKIIQIMTKSMYGGGAVIVSQSMGAGNTERVKKVMGMVFRICMIYWVIVGAASLLFPEQIFSVFTKDPEVLALSHEYMPSFALWTCTLSLLAPLMTLANGIGNPRFNVAMGLLDGVVARIGLSVLLGSVLGYGYLGYWYGNAMATFASIALGLIYYLSGKWKTYKAIKK